MEYFHCQLGLAVYAPSQLLHICSFAEYGTREKVLDFLATTKNLQYYQHSSCSKAKPQQLLGWKLTLSQLKPGHHKKLMHCTNNAMQEELIRYERYIVSFFYCNLF